MAFMALKKAVQLFVSNLIRTHERFMTDEQSVKKFVQAYKNTKTPYASNSLLTTMAQTCEVQ